MVSSLTIKDWDLAKGQAPPPQVYVSGVLRGRELETDGEDWG